MFTTRMEALAVFSKCRCFFLARCEAILEAVRRPVGDHNWHGLDLDPQTRLSSDYRQPL